MLPVGLYSLLRFVLTFAESCVALVSQSMISGYV